MTKLQLLSKITDIDKQLLETCENQHLFAKDLCSLKKADLERFLDALQTINEIFLKLWGSRK